MCLEYGDIDGSPLSLSKGKGFQLVPIMVRQAHHERKVKEAMGSDTRCHGNAPMDKSCRSKEPIRVLLIDESVIALQGLKSLLSKQNLILVVGTACSEIQARVALETCRPNVVVLDVQIGSTSGISLCQTIRESHPHVGVLFFTAADEAHVLRAAIAAGAQGYLLKTASGEALMKSIEAVALGRAMIDRHLTPQVMRWIRDGIGAAPHSSLAGSSADDRRILSRVAAGKTNGEIAQELSMERRMVLTRLRRIYKRLNIFRRAEVVGCFLRYERELLSGRTHVGRDRLVAQAGTNFPHERGKLPVRRASDAKG